MKKTDMAIEMVRYASFEVESDLGIITSVQVKKAVFADCHLLQEAVENSERVHLISNSHL